MTLRKKTRLIFSLMLTGLVGVRCILNYFVGKLKNVEQDTRQIVKEVLGILLKTKMTLVLAMPSGQRGMIPTRSMRFKCLLTSRHCIPLLKEQILARRANRPLLATPY